MNILDIKLENCYGIGKFEYSFDFSSSNTHIIYAPNGTMKTSFARTLDDISKNDKKFKPCDRIFQNRQTHYEIKADGNNLPPETILVIDVEDVTLDRTGKISTFIASKELKKRYDNLYSELEFKNSEFIKRLKQISQSSDCESEFTNTFTTKLNSFNESLNLIVESLNEKNIQYRFRYNDIFDKKGKVKSFLEKNQHLLKQYIEKYEDLLTKSDFFKKSDNSFGTYQASELLKAIKDNSFFEAGHKFLLDGNISIESAESIERLIVSEIDKIIKDERLKAAFDQVDKASGSNVELRAFKAVIEKDNLLLLELEDYDNFKKKVWISYFSELKNEAEELSKFYNYKKKDLLTIVEQAKKEFDVWRVIIKKFNSRFYVPFTVKLTNQEDVILKEETANLEFLYSDKPDPNKKPVNQDRETLLKVLCKGEQRAFFILQMLFDIESRKGNATNLIVFDDIADSFDYKNKYAIIEYLQELKAEKNFRIIILTHNFDFYRTVSSRLNLRSSVYMASKDPNRIITLSEGQYRNNLLKNFLRRIEDPKIFISLIAFTRNIIEYTEPDNSADYKKLTSCLHLKEDSSSITANDILVIYKSKFSNLNDKTIIFESENIIKFIIETANSIFVEKSINETLLENKIVLSIAIRLKAEEYMIKNLPSLDILNIETNQTYELYKEFCKLKKLAKNEILDKVNLMTPENIHMNAFMYEPLIDMSLFHLKDLYEEVGLLN